MSDLAPKFRRPEGVLLRSGLDAIARMGIEIPDGARGRVGIAVELEDGTLGAEIGAAWLTARGWKVDATVGAAIARGQTPRVTGALQVTF